MKKRTDLALEARELWQESAEAETRLPGVRAEEHSVEGMTVTRVDILDEQGVEALGKPVGSYVTVELLGSGSGEDSFARTARTVAGELRQLLPILKNDTVLVVGLGNRHITPDAIGPLCMESLMVTRHLVDKMPDYFGHMRQVAALAPGVLGSTGIETAEIIRGVVDRTRPNHVIIIDALASRKMTRLCRTIQLADTGIVPGSGVGNARAGINRQTLGVPVIAIGVPTVVDAATLAADLLEESGISEYGPEVFAPLGADMIVTPKEIDSQVADIARIVAYAINICLHEVGVEDVTGFLGAV